MQKYTRNALGHMLKHYAREKDQDGKYVRFGNQNIDEYFTQNNYNLAPQHEDGLTDYEFIKKRTTELKALKRKDVNVMATWVVTIPQEYLNKIETHDFFLDEEEDTYRYKFFKETYNFLENKYGKDNVVGGFVHLDETTPHMHFAFIPTVWDNKKQRLKVSAKECLNKKALQKFHPELNAYLNRALKKELKELDMDDIGVMIKDPRQKFTPVKDLEKQNKDLRKKIIALEKENNLAKTTLKQIKYQDGRTGLDFYNKMLQKQKTKNKNIDR